MEWSKKNEREGRFDVGENSNGLFYPPGGLCITMYLGPRMTLIVLNYVFITGTIPFYYIRLSSYDWIGFAHTTNERENCILTVEFTKSKDYNSYIWKTHHNFFWRILSLDY